MSVDPDDIKLYLNQKSKEWEAQELRAARVRLPEDIAEYVDSCLKTVSKLPDELPQKQVIQKYLNVALRHYQEDDEKGVRRWIMKAEDNYKNALFDLEILKREQGARKGGQSPKRRQWAEEIADHLVRTRPNSNFEQVWKTLPEGESPEQIEAEQYDLAFYRDGEKLIAIDGFTTVEKGSLAQSSFKKRYFSPAKRKAGH